MAKVHTNSDRLPCWCVPLIWYCKMGTLSLWKIQNHRSIILKSQHRYSPQNSWSVFFRTVNIIKTTREDVTTYRDMTAGGWFLSPRYEKASHGKSGNSRHWCTRLPCGQPGWCFLVWWYGEGPRPMWVVPSLGRWSWGIEESKLSKLGRVDQ